MEGCERSREGVKEEWRDVNVLVESVAERGRVWVHRAGCERCGERCREGCE